MHGAEDGAETLEFLTMLARKMEVKLSRNFNEQVKQLPILNAQTSIGAFGHLVVFSWF